MNPGDLLCSLRHPWSEVPTLEEEMYRFYGFIRTASSVFHRQILLDFGNGNLRKNLIDSFELLHKEIRGSKLTVGARALFKHFERNSRYSNDPKNIQKAFKHPFWNKPTGSDIAKNQTALEHLKEFLALLEIQDPSSCWKNIHQIHPNDTTIIEIRNTVTYHGMRWRISFDEVDINGHYCLAFRGFVEP